MADCQFYPVNNSSIVKVAKNFSHKIEKENQFLAQLTSRPEAKTRFYEKYTNIFTSLVIGCNTDYFNKIIVMKNLFEKSKDNVEKPKIF